METAGVLEETMGPRGPSNTDIKFDRMDHKKMLVYGVGMFSGMITVLFPLSVLKTKQMASPDINPGFSGAKEIAKQVWKTEGIRGFYRGYSTILTGAIPTRMIYLPTYEVTRTAFSNALEGVQDKLNLTPTFRASASNCVGGAVASLASSAIVVPIDVVSQRLMVDKGTPPVSPAKPALSSSSTFVRTTGNLHPGVASTSSPSSPAAMLAGDPRTGRPGGSGGGMRAYASNARAGLGALETHGRMGGYSMAMHILRTEGLAGLYRGFGMSIITYTPSSAMWWAAYALYQDLVWGALYKSGVRVSNDDALSITAVQAVCGMLSGTTASIITCPLDVVKTQLQVAGRNEDTARLSTWQMVQKVYAREGLAGFWRGAVPRVANVALWGTCMVTTYEVLKRLCVRDDEPLHSQ